MGWSYDDKYIGLVSTENQRFEIKLVDQGSGNVRTYPENDGMRRAQWSAVRGEMLVDYSSLNPLAMDLPPLPPIEKLLVINTDTFEVIHAVSRDGNFGTLPAWTSKGDRVAYWKDLESLCVMEVNTQEENCQFFHLPSRTQAASFGDASPTLSWDSQGHRLAISVVEQGSPAKNLGYIFDVAGNLLIRSENLSGFVYWPPSGNLP